MSLLGGLIGKGAKLEKSLIDYPEFAFPHGGKGADLSEKERAENLAYFLAQKGERWQLVRANLSEFGVDVPAPADISDYETTSLALDRFSKSTMSQVRGIDKICGPGWRKRSRVGREAKIFSFVFDLGVYCGECVARTDLGFDWRIDDTAYRPADVMPTSGNVVLSNISILGPEPHRVFHDILGWTLFSVADTALAKAGKSLKMVNSFVFLDDFMSGGYQ